MEKRISVFIKLLMTQYAGFWEGIVSGATIGIEALLLSFLYKANTVLLPNDVDIKVKFRDFIFKIVPKL